LKINSQNLNGSPFPSNCYLAIRLGTKGELKLLKRVYDSHEFDLSASNALETLTIMVTQDKALAKDPIITQTSIRVFELFSSGSDSGSGGAAGGGNIVK
jgi:hypothetical protein